ncbi:MAG: DUF3159 domain-containing protein [Actinomycetaceae bacterium]|nr:DUF3159 domain-containing protein [Actinomycetaceae bacterium]
MTDTESNGEPKATSQPPVISQLNESQFNPLESIGGLRGAIESTLPGLIFVIVYVLTGDLRSTLIGAIATAIVLILARFATRQPVTYSVSGLIGVAIGVAWAFLTGRGEDFYSLGIFGTVFYALIVGLSIVFRVPVVSGLVTRSWNYSWKWWRNPQPDQVLAAKAGLRLTWMWFALFIVRLLVQVPLWLAGNVAWLGAAKLALGLPAFVLCAWITWIVLRPLTPEKRGENPDHEDISVF